MTTVPVLFSFGCLEGQEPQEITFSTPDRAIIKGLLYGDGPHVVILAHGAVFNKESWDRQARELSSHGFKVLAIDFRGFGESSGGDDPRALDIDLITAVSYLRSKGASKVSIVGGSLGANAAAAAVIRRPDLSIHRLILLSPPGVASPERVAAGKVVYIVSRDERVRKNVEAAYAGTVARKAIEILDGDTHAQHIFGTDQGERLLQLIVAYLEE